MKQSTTRWIIKNSTAVNLPGATLWALWSSHRVLWRRLETGCIQQLLPLWFTESSGKEKATVENKQTKKLTWRGTPWCQVVAASRCGDASLQPGSFVKVEGTKTHQNAQKSWRRSCCSLQEVCNLEDFFPNKMMTANRDDAAQECLPINTANVLKLQIRNPDFNPFYMFKVNFIYRALFSKAAKHSKIVGQQDRKLVQDRLKYANKKSRLLSLL